jgi:hypothetical protein
MTYKKKDRKMKLFKTRKPRSDAGKKRGTYTGEIHQVKTNDLLQIMKKFQ